MQCVRAAAPKPGSDAATPQGTLGNGWRHFWLSPLAGGEVLLVSGGWRPRRLLNTLQCAGWPLAENDLAPDVSGAAVGSETDLSRAVLLDNLGGREVLRGDSC